MIKNESGVLDVNKDEWRYFKQIYIIMLEMCYFSNFTQDAFDILNIFTQYSNPF